MAVEMLNGKDIREGFELKVEKAEFEMKGEEYKETKKAKINDVEKLRIKAQL